MKAENFFRAMDQSDSWDDPIVIRAVCCPGLNFQTPGNATMLSSGGIHACVLDTNKKARPRPSGAVKKSIQLLPTEVGLLGVLSCFHQRLDFGLCAYCNFISPLPPSLLCRVVRKFLSMEISCRPSQTNSLRSCWSGWSHDFSVVSVALSEL